MISDTITYYRTVFRTNLWHLAMTEVGLWTIRFLEKGLLFYFIVTRDEHFLDASRLC